MNPTLVVMAAGMGSRYGGVKQIDTFGPSGETIVDYTVYDALRRIQKSGLYHQESSSCRCERKVLRAN